ncbi:MAG TPA: permease prefix domain 1-containing protein [Micromonosporaceae bacterium]
MSVPVAEQAAGRGEIERYVAGLGVRLRGPRRFRTDLLDEARDSLLDAAEAYVDAGLPPIEAARRAIADFGTYADVLPSYQEELAVAQGRRTALLITLALPLLYLLAPLMWWRGAQPHSTRYVVLADGFDYLSLAGAALAALVLLGLGRGSRYVPDGARLTHGLGVGALGFLCVHGLVGAAIWVWSATEFPYVLSWPPMLLAATLMWLAFGYAALSAWRCLRTSGRVAVGGSFRSSPSAAA